MLVISLYTYVIIYSYNGVNMRVYKDVREGREMKVYQSALKEMIFSCFSRVPFIYLLFLYIIIFYYLVHIYRC